MKSQKLQSGLILILLAIALGICLRFLAVNQKLYWHDEVYTSMRATGFTRTQIDQDLFQNKLISASELQKYQEIKPNSTYLDTIQSLVIEDPQHPPLYFLMARQWLIWFGSSIGASRLLPALLSLLALPLMYGLAIALFAKNPNSKTIALIATAFLALSPFDILFAQTARQYSLLTVGVIATGYALLRALKSPTLINWTFYTLAVAIALYTHPFFGLSLIGHGVFIVASQRQQLRQFMMSLGVAIALYLPWIIVMASNFSRTTATTNWSNIPVGFEYLLKLWTLSFSSLFFDLDFGFNNPLTYILRIPIIALIIFSLYLIYRQSSAKWFIFTSIFVPFLLLLLPDLILGGKRSAVSRYLISCFPAIQLAMAYLFAQMLNFPFKDNFHKTIIWRGVLAILLTVSIVSSLVSANSQTWWNKDLSYFNAQVSDRLNTVSNAIVISDLGDDFTNTGDLISLSYMLNSDIKFLLLSPIEPNSNLDLIISLLKNFNINSAPVFVFRPSLKLLKFLKLRDPQDLVFAQGQLWQFKPDQS